jgi:PadR family transcriptional regulator PadR
MTMQTLAVLKALLVRPREARYGLDIAREAGLKSGTLYPALARLERAGWLESLWEDIDQAAAGRPRRRYYRLTTHGAVHAQRALEDAAHHLSLDWTPTRSGLPVPGTESA